MKNSKDKSGAGRASDLPDEQPSEREISQQQALKNAEAARDTHRSHMPGVADDSEVIQGWAAALAAPIEGAADAMREGERARVQSQSPVGKADDVTEPRSINVPNVTEDGRRRAQPPTHPEDAEWDPLKATAEHRSGNRRK